MAACRCGSRDAWRVWTREGGYPSFNGFKFTPGKSSHVVCETEHGGCGASWGTAAKYVADLPDSDEAARLRAIEPRVDPATTKARLADLPKDRCDFCHEAALPGNPLVGNATLTTHQRPASAACRL